VGLEGVEIVMATEETFGISIPDEAAQQIVTVRQLVDYVTARVQTTPETECRTQRLFYRLRRGFKTEVAALVPRFDLDLPLADIVHKDQWPRVWTAVRDRVGVSDWPDTVPWPGLLRDGPKTVRQLIWHLVWSLPRPTHTHGGAWTRSRIEAEVRRIIAEVLGEKDYRLAARFAEDLGVS